MRIASLLVAAALATGCSTGNLKTPDLGSDLGAPADLARVIEAKMIAPATTMTSCLAADAARVYWSDGSGSAPQIVSVPLGGGTPMPLVTGGDANACVAVGSDSAFYFDGDKLMKVPLAGGSATPLASGQHILPTSPLVVSGDKVYWLTDVYGALDAFSGKNALVSLATNAPANSTPTVVSAEIGINAAGLAVDATSFYYGDSDGVSARLLANPATLTKIAKVAINPPAFTVGAGHVAVAELTSIGAGDIAVFRTDGMGRMQLTTRLGKPLALDDKAVYVGFSGSLERVPLDASPSVQLGAVSARAVALAPGLVVFTDGAALWTVPR